MNTIVGTNNDDILNLNFSNLPRLIGRSKEQQILNGCFVRLSNQGAKGEIILVHGESGVGKSTLIQHLEQKVLKSKSLGGGHYYYYFATGKYEQLKNSTRPYSAIVDAITDLCNQVTDNSKVLKQVQNEMFQVMGNETTILTNLIPDLINLLHPPLQGETSQENTKINNDDNKATPQNRQKEQDNETIELKSTTGKIRKNIMKENSVSSMSSHFSNINATNNNASSTSGFSFRIFAHLFRTFLRTFCKPTRPLVLFLDDLQWSDEASRKLIAMIAADPTLQNLIIVAAFRDNDDASYNFDSKTCKFQITDIHVGPISQDSISEIISIVTKVSQDEPKCIALGEVVSQKTGGNVFFAIQYLEALYRQKLIFYDFVCTKWNWNVEKIKVNTSVSDNIVDLLIGKIHGLPKVQQSVLMFAACIGFSFDTNILQGILQSQDIVQNDNDKNEGTIIIDNSQFLAELLVELSNQGLVEPFNERKYQFTHDRVQQSAYLLLPSQENDINKNDNIKEADQLLICVGEHILDHCISPDGERWMLFRAVDLLSEQSIVYAGTDKEKKMELVHLNLQAAREAIPQMAFISAAHYVQQALDFMDPATMWEDQHYDLTLELFTMHAKMQHACGNLESSFKIADIILQRAKTLQDQLPAYYLQTVLLGEQDDITGAISILRKIFKETKVSIPRRANKIHVILELIKTNNSLKGRSAQDFANLPTMTDPIKIMTMQFLLRYAVNSYEKEDLDSAFIASIRMARMTIKHGVSPLGAIALVNYGSVLAVLGNVDEAYQYGKLGYELLKRPGMESGHVSCVHNTCMFLDHLKLPVQDFLTKLIEAYRIGIELGEVEFSIYCLTSHTLVSIHVGMRLDNSAPQIKSYLDLMLEFNQESRYLSIVPYYQFALNLAGKTKKNDPLLLVGDGMDEKTLETINQRSSLISRQECFCHMIIRYIFGAYDLAEQDRKRFETYDTRDAHFHHYFLSTYAGLICYAMARQCLLKKQFQKKKKYERLAQPYVKRITRYTNDGSVNGPPMLKLLQAEALSSIACKDKNNNNNNVKQAYDVAIQFARRSGFRLFTAIGLERAGDYFYSILGDTDLAEEYLRSAYMEFKEIDALGKTKAIKEKYTWLRIVDNEDEEISSSSASRLFSSMSKKMTGTVLSSIKDKEMDHKQNVFTGRGVPQGQQGSSSKNFTI